LELSISEKALASTSH